MTTNAERIAPVLAWLNDRRNIYELTPSELTRWAGTARRAVSSFLRSIDGSPEVGRLKVVSPNRPEWMRKPAKPLDEDALETMHVELTLLLEQQADEGAMPLPSLRFGWSHGVLRVSGSQHDLTVFCTMHLLLTQEFASELGRCKAPRRYRYGDPERCGKWFVQSERGRRREFCKGGACKQRDKEERLAGKQPRGLKG